MTDIIYKHRPTPTLPLTAPRRLAALRAEAVRQGAATWRKVRWAPSHLAGAWQDIDPAARLANLEDRAYYCDTWPAGWREVGDASKIVRSLPDGWYADDMCDRTIRGFVLRLPARNGEPRFVPAVYDTGSDGVTLYPLAWRAEEDEAARAADHFAERVAEGEREYNAQFLAEQETEDLRAEIVSLRS